MHSPDILECAIVGSSLVHNDVSLGCHDDATFHQEQRIQGGRYFVTVNTLRRVMI